VTSDGEQEARRVERRKVARRGPPPPVFVSVASKGLSNRASLLFATLAGRSISVAS